MDSSNERGEVSILTVLNVDLCARAIFDLVPVRDLVRSQRVSRQWQGVVHHYLRSCRTLSFHYVCPDDSAEGNAKSHHRRIEISPPDHSPLLACEIAKKWGRSIVEINTAGDWHDVFETKEYQTLTKVIAAKCINLRKITMFVTKMRQLNNIKNMKYLKDVSLHFFNVFTKRQDHTLGELFQNMNCESITIDFNVSLTGKFLSYITSTNLKSLCFNDCQYLKIPDLATAIDSLRNVIRLQIDDSRISVFRNMHLLLREMPQLEELSLRGYKSSVEGDLVALKDEWYRSFSELVNLKRLNMENTHYVNDTLLKALGRGCKKLELLDIRGNARRISVDGVAALCQRSASAVTTLHFGLLDHELDGEELDVYFSCFFEDVPLYEDLEELGCIELTPEWVRAACRDPDGRELALNPGSGRAAVEDPQKELKIILFDITYDDFSPLD